LRQVRVGVRDREQARAERDLLFGELVGEALAVVALVHVLERLRDLRGEAHGFQQL
jgi:hypothetical protein